MSTRARTTRIEDALGRLATDPNVWIATASPEGEPHLVPLSLAWIDGDVVVSTPTDTPTVRNVRQTGRARLALDSTADVVMIDTNAIALVLDDATPELVADYARRVGWDPRDESGSWSLLRLTPTRVQSWNSVAEIAGRTIMRNGHWLE